MAMGYPLPIMADVVVCACDANTLCGEQHQQQQMLNNSGAPRAPRESMLGKTTLRTRAQRTRIHTHTHTDIDKGKNTRTRRHLLAWRRCWMCNGAHGFRVSFGHHQKAPEFLEFIVAYADGKLYATVTIHAHIHTHTCGLCVVCAEVTHLTYNYNQNMEHPRRRFRNLGGNKETSKHTIEPDTDCIHTANGTK